MQSVLAGKVQRGRPQQPASEHLLTGRIRDDRGNAMSPSHARKGVHRYRYYISQAVLKGRAEEAGSVRRVSAPAIEGAVVQALRTAVPKTDQPREDRVLVERHLAKLIVHPTRLELHLAGDGQTVIQHDWAPPPTTRRREIVLPPGAADQRLRPMKVEDRARILKAIGTARLWLDELTSGRMDDTAAIAGREILSERAVRMTLSLAFLSPRIVAAITDAKLQRGIAIRDLAALPVSWAEQHRALGL